MSDFTNGVREMVAFLRGAIAARPNDTDGEAIGNIANLLELCADKLAARDAEVAELADKVREECALEAEKQAKDEPYGHAAYRCVSIAAAIRAMKERP